MMIHHRMNLAQGVLPSMRLISESPRAWSIAGSEALDPPGAAAIERPWWFDEAYLSRPPADAH